MNKLIYFIKQPFPLKYHSKYRIQNGGQYLALWTQWLGKPFNVKHFRRAD